MNYTQQVRLGKDYLRLLLMKNPKIGIFSSGFPRLEIDQMLSLLPVPSFDAIDPLLKIVSKMTKFTQTNKKND